MNSCVNSSYLSITWNVISIEQVELKQALIELVDDTMLETEETVGLVDLDGELVVDSLDLHVLAHHRVRVGWIGTDRRRSAPRTGRSGTF